MCTTVWTYGITAAVFDYKLAYFDVCMGIQGQCCGYHVHDLSR